jgi:hypothetical protein
MIECLFYNAPAKSFKEPLCSEVCRVAIGWLLDRSQEWPHFACQNEVLKIKDSFSKKYLIKARYVLENVLRVLSY